MSNLEVVRAWKDPEFRATLGDVTPDHPAGQILLADPGLDGSAAAGQNLPILSLAHQCHSLFTHCKSC